MTELLGWVGSALVILSLTQRDVRRLRQVNLVASIVLGVFNVLLGIPSMVVLNIVLAAINIRHLRRGVRPAGQPSGSPVRVLVTSTGAAGPGPEWTRGAVLSS